MGHEVTSTWHDDTADGDRDDGHRLSATPEAKAVIIARDMHDILRCETFIAFTEPEGSSYTRGTRHAETGYALGWEKRLYLVGEREGMLFHWLPRTQQFATWEECAAFLRG